MLFYLLCHENLRNSRQSRFEGNIRFHTFWWCNQNRWILYRTITATLFHKSLKCFSQLSFLWYAYLSENPFLRWHIPTYYKDFELIEAIERPEITNFNFDHYWSLNELHQRRWTLKIRDSFVRRHSFNSTNVLFDLIERYLSYHVVYGGRKFIIEFR